MFVKVPTALAVMLFISTVSAQAMQFADRPGLISEGVSSSAATRALPRDDGLRRQITNRHVLLSNPVTGTKLADRPRPIRIRMAAAEMMFEVRPGRLSAEFSAVVKSHGMRFEYGPGIASGWLKAAAAGTATRLEHRPANRFTNWAAGSIKVGHRDDFTSSLTRMGVQSKTYHPDRL
jgi:hypothetical protein